MKVSIAVIEKFMYNSEHLAKNCEKLNFSPRTEGHYFVLVFAMKKKLVPHCKTLTPVIQKLNVQLMKF